MAIQELRAKHPRITEFAKTLGIPHQRIGDMIAIGQSACARNLLEQGEPLDVATTVARPKKIIITE